VNFASDNTSVAAPAILEAVIAANAAGPAMPYGNDDWTRRVVDRLKGMFECDLTAFPVATGTAANALALSVLMPPYGALFCHEVAHIQVDECGAPEFYTGGAKLVTLPGDDAKIDASTLDERLRNGWIGNVHNPQPKAVSITQITETGGLYSADEIAAIADVAHRQKLRVHMDGARFANALAASNAAPADITWRAGVDVLSFGATKNGALAAEAVVFFDPKLAQDFAFRRKRGGHLFSKMRFVSAQLEAYLANDLWLANARHANAMLQRLKQGLASLPGVTVHGAAAANLMYVTVPNAMVDGLEQAGFKFYREGGEGMIRLVAAFNTDPKHVDLFLETARRFSR
jgi:threonine aldolase